MKTRLVGRWVATNGQLVWKWVEVDENNLIELRPSTQEFARTA